MSEGFELEPFHVPQQSRRDKLRETTSTGCAGLLPLYDPSLLTSSMLTCAPSDQNPPLISSQCMNFMGFLGTGNSFLSSSSSSSQLLLDLPQSSISINPTCNEQDINNNSSSNPFLFASQIPQNLRDFDPSFDNAPQASSYAPHDTKSTGQGLSLSLSSQYRNRSDVGNYVVRASDSMVRSLAPIGPFTGYAAILKGSRFLKPAQQLLEEFCDVGRGFYMERNGGESSSSSVGREMENLSESGIGEDGQVGVSGGGERRRMKARLISMLNEVWYTFALSLL